MDLSGPKRDIELAARIVRTIPLSFVRKLQAHRIRTRLEKLMPNSNLNISVSDPISAMVCAALNFLSTPAGQQIVNDLRTVVVDLVNHVHSRVTPTPSKS